MVKRHALRIVLGAVASLLVVPVAVNIGTGGNAPGWLKPFVNWLWPVAIACVLLVIVLELWDKREAKDRISVRRPYDPRNIELALTQVARYVEARKRGSLAEQVRLALALDERPDAVRQPAHLVARVAGGDFQLSAELTIANVFAQMNESMLILGAPGAGKTTQLLDLAQALIGQARSAPDPAVPVLLDLADWIVARRAGAFRLGRGDDTRATFDSWVVASLANRFRIPEGIGRLWLAENRLTLLLDGLDEVPDTEREACVAEINTLQRDHGVTRVAVCSREADYARLSAQLALQGAVVIRPLDRETVRAYLASVGSDRTGVLAALDADEELWDLLTTPLMLTIVLLAGIDQAAHPLPETTEPAGQRRLLFDAYVVEVLARRRTNELGDPERMLRAIHTLALATISKDSGVRVPPLDFTKSAAWLPEPVAGMATIWIGRVAMLAGAMAWTAASALRFGGWASIIPLVFGLSFVRPTSVTYRPARIANRSAFVGMLLATTSVPAGLAVAVLALFAEPRIALVVICMVAALLAPSTMVIWGMWETPFRSRNTPRQQAILMSLGLLAAGGVLLVGLRRPLLEGWLLGFALGTWTLLGAFIGTDVSARTDAVSTYSRRAWIPAILYAAASLVLLLVLVLSDRWLRQWEPAMGFLVGLVYAFVAAGVFLIMFVGNQAIRAAMTISGETNPWRRSFLRYATDRSLLTRTDGEYRFIHLLVRDHLAECDPARLGSAVVQRRAELQR